MIDIEKLKAVTQAKVTDPDAVLELIERLEKAEKNSANYKAQLAESQAREKKMRAAFEDMYNGWLYIRSTHGDLYGVGWDRAQNKAEQALASPSNATALNELIAKAGEVMRVQAVGKLPSSFHNWVDSIKALPGVTLEDLK